MAIDLNEAIELLPKELNARIKEGRITFDLEGDVVNWKNPFLASDDNIKRFIAKYTHYKLEIRVPSFNSFPELRALNGHHPHIDLKYGICCIGYPINPVHTTKDLVNFILCSIESFKTVNFGSMYAGYKDELRWSAHELAI